jgi:hypothetical protein
VIAAEVFASKVPEAGRTAVRLWLPTVKPPDTTSVATSLDRTPVPRVVAPSLKVTVPDTSVSLPLAAVAVSVTEVAWTGASEDAEITRVGTRSPAEVVTTERAGEKPHAALVTGDSVEW